MTGYTYALILEGREVERDADPALLLSAAAEAVAEVDELLITHFEVKRVVPGFVPSCGHRTMGGDTVCGSMICRNYVGKHGGLKTPEEKVRFLSLIHI